MIEKLRGVGRDVKKFALNVGRGIKFFFTAFGQIIFWIIVALLCVILLYILAETIAVAVGKIIGKEDGGIKNSVDYQVLQQLTDSGYNSLMDSKELQEYMNYEYAVLMDAARFFQETGVYELPYEDTVNEIDVKALSEDEAAKLFAFGMSGTDKKSEVFKSFIEGIKNKQGVKQEGPVSVKYDRENITNEHSGVEMFYKIAKNNMLKEEGSDKPQESVVPYLRIRREASKYVYYYLDDQGLTERDGTQLSGYNSVAGAAASGLDWEALYHGMKLYDYNKKLNVSNKRLWKHLRGNGSTELLMTDEEYLHDSKFIDKIDMESVTYEIPFKVLVDRFLPKAQLLSSWYMLKDKTGGQNGAETTEVEKLLDQIKEIYDAACFSYKDEKYDIQEELLKAEDEKNGVIDEDEYTNLVSFIVFERIYQEFYSRGRIEFGLDEFSAVTDLVHAAHIDINDVSVYYREEGSAGSTYLTDLSSEVSSILDGKSNFRFLDSTCTLQRITCGKDEEAVQYIGSEYGYSAAPLELTNKDDIITDVRGSKEYRRMSSISGYYYLRDLASGGKVNITDPAELEKDIENKLESMALLSVSNMSQLDPTIDPKNIVVSVKVSVSDVCPVYKIEHIKFGVKQELDVRRMPTYFPAQATTWSRYIEFNNLVSQGAKFEPLDIKTIKLYGSRSIELGTLGMTVSNDSKWRVSIYSPLFTKVREKDTIAMFAEWEALANDGEFAADTYIRDLYRLIEYSKSKYMGGSATVDDNNYIYINIPDEILYFDENVTDYAFWMDHFLATSADPIEPQESLIMRSRIPIMKWQQVDYSLYDECKDEATGKYRVYALWPLGGYVSKSLYAISGAGTVPGNNMIENWGGWQWNGHHEGVDLYGRRIASRLADAIDDSGNFTGSVDIPDFESSSFKQGSILRIKTDDEIQYYSNTGAALYGFELYRLKQASGDSTAATILMDEIKSEAKETPVISVAPGIVVEVKAHPNSGFRVKVRHTKGNYEDIYTYYMHMKRYPSVQEGEYVGAGTVLGYEGTTGGSGAVHVHFEVANLSDGGKGLYPIPYLYPFFTPFYLEPEGSNAYDLSDEHISLLRTVYPAGLIVPDELLKTRSSDGTLATRVITSGRKSGARINQVKVDSDGVVERMNYVPSKYLVDNCEKLPTKGNETISDNFLVEPGQLHTISFTHWTGGKVKTYDYYFGMEFFDHINFVDNSGTSSPTDPSDPLNPIQTVAVKGRLSPNSKYKLSNGHTIDFWLYVPENATPNMPVIVYWHGGGEVGGGLNVVYNNTTICKNLDKNIIGVNAIVVVPCLKGINNEQRDTLRLLEDLSSGIFKDEFGNTISISMDRMGIIGFSRGTQLLMNYARSVSTNQFKVVALVSSFWDERSHEKFANAKKVYCIRGDNDAQNAQKYTDDNARRIEKAGGNVVYRLLKDEDKPYNVGHGEVQKRIFGDSQLLQEIAYDLWN